MRINQVIFGTMFLIILALTTGCQDNQITPTDIGPPAKELVDYLPKQAGSFFGDGDYFHVVNTIDLISETPQYELLLSGEIVVADRVISSSDSSFKTRLWVDHEKMVQINERNNLNDSEFQELILLQKPLTESSQWSFTTKDFFDEKIAVTAEIMNIEDDKIEVHYRSETRGSEIRVFQKDRGTIAFTKEILYKGARAITGYHLGTSELSLSEETYNYIDPIKLDGEILSLIEAFNLFWHSMDRKEDPSIFDWVLEDSEAAKKLNATLEIESESVQYLGFKALAQDEDAENLYITVVEKYEEASGNALYVTIRYQIKQIDSDYYIEDFVHMGTSINE